MIRKIVLGCCIGICSLNASNSNVASLTDLKEAVHFLLKDYKEQTKRIEILEAKINTVNNETKKISSIESKLNNIDLETKRIANMKSSNAVNNNTLPVKDLKMSNEVGNEDDRIILDYIKERTISR